MMKATGSDQHLRTFAKVLEKAIAKYGDLSDEDLTTRQKRQVETLVAQEIDFRETLAKHPAGRKIYDQFCYYICEERRNILSARPFFRERQGVFMEFISPALKMGDGQALFPFGINYNFVRWVLKQKDWPAGSKLHKIARQIQQSRKELVEMNMPLALSRARIFWNKTRSSVMTTSEVLPGGSHLDYMDLVQIAAGGLIAGIDKFVLPYSHTFRAVVIGRIVGDTIEQFCLLEDTILNPCDQKPKKLKDFRPGDLIQGIDNDSRTIQTEVLALHDHGVVEGFEYTFDDGYQVVCSENHKFLTDSGMISIKDIVRENKDIFCEPAVQARWMDRLLRSEVREKEGNVCTSQDVRTMQGRSPYQEGRMDDPWQGQLVQTRRLDGQLWTEFRQTQGDVPTSKDLSGMYRKNQSRAGEGLCPMEGDTSGGICSESGEGVKSICSDEERRSPSKQGFRKEDGRSPEKMDSRKPRSVRGPSQEDVGRIEQQVQIRGLVKSQRDPDLAVRQDRVWERSETDRFCQPGSQNLGGSGWELSFSGNSSKVRFGENPEQRQDAQRRSSETQGCNASSSFDAMFSPIGAPQGRMADLAYGHAPLSNTRGLVRRRVVRVRPVGPKRMYDLEVAHPKHNFLLPNGIVTSNSETLLHFFPGDKRKIYRGRKFIGKTKEPDPYRMAVEVNKDMEGKYTTNPSEMNDLMKAATCESADAEIAHGDDGESLRVVDSLGDDPALQPDNKAEKQEIYDKLEFSLSTFPALEQKLIKLKGVEFH